MDVARFLVRNKCSLALNETFNINIKEEVFRIKMTKYSDAPIRISLKQSKKVPFQLEDSSDYSSM